MSDWIPVLIGVALLNHLLLSPDPEQRSTSLDRLGPSAAVLLSLACPLLYGLNAWLEALGAGALYWLGAVWLIAACSQLVLYLAARLRAHTPDATLWPLLLGNAVLALPLAADARSLGASILIGLGAGFGLWLLLVIFHDWRQRLERCALPAALRGAPILLISAGLFSWILLGLDGMGAV